MNKVVIESKVAKAQGKKKRSNEAKGTQKDHAML